MQHRLKSEIDISVIVVTYNQEGTIARTLDSVLAQRTGAEFEIIIGDDCSTDGTEAVCRSYAAKYPDKIVYLRRDKNMGVTANYFDCIERSRGRYLADCAGDDFWCDDSKLHRQFEALEADPDISLCLTEWICRNSLNGDTFRHSGISHYEQRAIYPAGTLSANILIGIANTHLCTALYRKDVLCKQVEKARNIFIDPLYTCEDQQILLALAQYGKVLFMPETTLQYSVGHESISHPRSFANRFDYSVRATRQSIILKNYFQLKNDDNFSRFYKRKCDYIWAMLFRTLDTNRRNRLIVFSKEYRLNGGIKSRIYQALSKCRPIWKLAYRIITHKDK